MKVGYVLKRYPRYSETFIVNEILAHEASGLEIEIFALRPPTDNHFQDVISRVQAPVNYVQSSGIRAPEFWEALQRVGELRPDVWPELEHARGEEGREVFQALQLALATHEKGITHLHAHFGTDAAAVARLASKFGRVPYTFTAHAKDIFHESVNPEDLGRKLREAASVITVSDYNLDYLLENYGPDTPPLYRLYNGLELERFPYGPPESRPRKIVGVGRLVEKKGFVELVKACALLKSRGVEFECEIVGTGELEDELRARISALDLEDRVKLTGPRPQREVIRTVQEATAFAAPCVVGADGNRDGLPTVLLEAMALGTPCVSTDVTGIPEVLRHEETGLMVPQHDPAALSLALERLLDDGPLRARLARNARRLIEDEFDIECNAARLRSIFEAMQHVRLVPLSEAR
jgi:colanic acid/amylovoran biosynthesis glycosyltransferase